MTLARAMKITALTILPLGLIYGVSTGGSPFERQGMAVELGCLAAGAVLFLAGHLVEKKRG